MIPADCSSGDPVPAIPSQRHLCGVPFITSAAAAQKLGCLSCPVGCVPQTAGTGEMPTPIAQNPGNQTLFAAPFICLITVVDRNDVN